MKKQYKKIEIMMNHAFKTEDDKGVITGNLVALDYGYVDVEKIDDVDLTKYIDKTIYGFTIQTIKDSVEAHLFKHNKDSLPETLSILGLHDANLNSKEEIFDATFSFAKNVIIEEFMPMFTEKYGITTEEELYAYVSDENNKYSEVTDTVFGLLKTLQGNLMMAIGEAIGTTYQLEEFARPKVLH
nr:MAG TPA: hypothetical protein [Caudoviricetes sp.]